jgi:hypothetical protein
MGLGAYEWRRVRRASAQALCLFPLFAFSGTCEVAADSGANPHWRIETNSFAAGMRNLHQEMTLTWTPFAALQEPGWRVRAAGALAVWLDEYGADPWTLLPKGQSELTIGYRWRFDRFAITAGAGPQFTTGGEAARWRRMGAAAHAQIVWSPREDLFVSAFLRGGTVDRTLALTVTSGWTTPFAVKLGPELGVSFNPAGTAVRAGLAVTGIYFFDYELALSIGLMRNERGRSVPYGGLWLARPF